MCLQTIIAEDRYMEILFEVVKFIRVMLIFKAPTTKLGAYRVGLSVRLSVRFLVWARTFEWKVIETWLFSSVSLIRLELLSGRFPQQLTREPMCK